mmetsp:Transcript_78525/g.139273  ORF Transcript_78525/g.139273 Transcript_78525/m.139273 type:complete len:145 (-) Transcript_78525:63-497(-)
MKRSPLAPCSGTQISAGDLDPQDFAKRCRIDEAADAHRLGVDADGLAARSTASIEEWTRRHLMKYLRSGQYVDRSGVGEVVDPVAPHEPAAGASYRSLLALRARIPADSPASCADVTDMNFEVAGSEAQSSVPGVSAIDMELSM